MPLKYGLLAVCILVLAHSESDAIKCENNPNERSAFLWLIKSPNNARSSFLFGTIHVAYDRVWSSVSPKFKEVLTRVNALVLELALHDASTVEKLIQCKQLQNGETLQQLLPSSLFIRLKKYFGNFRQRKRFQSDATMSNATRSNEQMNLLVGSWEDRRPVWLLFLLYQLSDEQLKQANTPMLDTYLAQRGQSIGKQLYSIETPDEQCNPLISIDQEQLIFAINYTLSYLEWTRNNPHRLTPNKSTIEDLVHKYSCGNPEVTKMEGWRLHESGFSLRADLDEQAKKVDQQLKHDIIDQRNARMAMRIHELIKSQPDRSFLFALGAGHFHGQYSLIKILRNYGYIVEVITEETNIEELFSEQDNFKNFNQLWIRNNKEERQESIHVEEEENQRHYYIIILFVTILLFVLITHRLSQYLLRVVNRPKLTSYNQVAVLPNYL